MWKASPVNRENRTVPPGWYPDPAGLSSWRAWNGNSWSTLTVAYPPVTVFRPTLRAAQTTQHLATWGLVTYFTGLALAMWSLSITLGAQFEARRLSPTSSRRLDAVLFLGIVLATWGTVALGRNIRALTQSSGSGRTSWLDWVPLVNLIVWVRVARPIISLPFQHATVVVLVAYDLIGLVRGFANHHLPTSNILVGAVGLAALFFGLAVTEVHCLIKRTKTVDMSDTGSQTTL